MRRPRHLSPDERALWDHVARTVERRGPVARLPDPAPVVIPKPVTPEKPPLATFRVGEKADHQGTRNLIGGLAQDMGRPPVKMDARAHQKLIRGKLRPEGRIDLHGMTLDQAHPALRDFILMSHAAGRRLVLVITGKGRERDDRPFGGLLRRQVPLWLGLAPLAPLILQTAPAHISHGGAGALYVYLRRTR
jgi:DNA-nicking Smr family endonuclease